MGRKAVHSAATKATPKKRGSRRRSLILNLKQGHPNYDTLVQILKRDFKGVQTTPMPAHLEPMLATLSDGPFSHSDWLFEIKWDGYRSIAYINKGDVQLRSRGNLSFNQDYPEVYEALKKWPVNVVVDGEIAVLTKEGKADFEALQNWKRRKTGTIVYYVFDLLWLDGISLLNEPLYKRKAVLQKLLPQQGLIRYSDSLEEAGEKFFEVAKANDLEGIVAKHKESRYTPGKRTKQWLKMPTHQRQEFVIGGWVESESGRAFKSLLFGYYEDGRLLYSGHSGGGFTEKKMTEIYQRLKKLETTKSPFSNEVDREGKMHWVRPELVAEIKYASRTSSGKIRKPAIFLGFRSDKDPRDVVIETATAPDVEKTSKSKPATMKTVMETGADSNWPELEKQEITSSAAYEFDGKQVVLINVERKLWGELTKAHLLMYYHSICPFLLPHLQDRPLSLHIKPRGPMAPGLYIKDMEGREPAWATVFADKRKHKKEGKRDRIDYLVCNDEATLQYAVNLGCIDLNPWTSRVTSPANPDYIVIDLDPSDDDFSKAVETAMAAQQLFKKEKIMAFPKTSGKTGLHVYLPCQGFSFTQARAIAENLCSAIHQLVPGITTTEVSIRQRGTKLYLDPNQNDYADTVAAPYCLRPYKIPSVSTPLDWKEIKPGLDPAGFDMKTVLARLEKKGDLFAGVLSARDGVRNNKALIRFM